MISESGCKACAATLLWRRIAILKNIRAWPVYFLLAAILMLAFFSGSKAAVVEIHPASEFAANDNSIICAISWSIPQGLYAYAHLSGDAGRPTTLDFSVEDMGAMRVWYPSGFMQRDIYDSEATVYTWRGNVQLFVLLPKEAAGKKWTADLSMLLCSKRNCTPLKTKFSGRVPDKPAALASVPFREMGEKALAQLNADGNGGAAKTEGNSEAPSTFVPQSSTDDSISSKESASQETLHTVSMPPLQDFKLVLFPRYLGDSPEIYSLGKALLFGMLAGLLLNAMPCVLPVLTFKISGLLLVAGVEEKRKMRNLREHNLFFAAGIMTLFTILALVLGLCDLMWGQLYQSQVFLLAMLELVFLMGISMLGVFNLPTMDLRSNARTDNPHLSAYLAGLVSTFLATPCSGPLLGGVLAWAFTQPLPVLMMVFWAVGMGMALPYLAICINPGVARILPQPGAWMLVFERLLGFMLLGTALYLLSILPTPLIIKTLCALLAISFCAWAWNAWCPLSAPRLRRKIGGAFFLAFIIVSGCWVLLPPEKAPIWQNFNIAEFRENLGKKPMFLEFTADWCPNCKFVEASTLNSANLSRLSARYHPEFVRVDLTNPNPYAEKLLEMLGSKSIPLSAFFPAGEDSIKPVVLRDIYDADSLFEAAAKAYGASGILPD